LAIVAAVHLNSLNVVVKIAKVPSFPIETKNHLPLGGPLVPGYPLALWDLQSAAFSFFALFFASTSFFSFFVNTTK
jgi:hypothetical protein